MGGFRGGDEPFGLCKQHRRLVALQLGNGHGVHQSFAHGMADQRGHPVVTQATGMDRRRDIGMAQAVHGQQRGHHGDIPGIIGKDAAGHLGTRRRFDGDNVRIMSAGDLVGHEREA